MTKVEVDELTEFLNSAVENSITGVLVALGENPQREGLKETPARYIKAMRFWTSGYNADPADVLKTFEDGAESYDELVFQGKIQIYSMCEHHLAPWWGVVHIGYLPNKKIVGLSKLARLVEIYARRLTVQERVTTDVASSLMHHLQCRGVGVVIQARHMCMESRGVQKPGTITTTSALRGVLKSDPSIRSEFLSFVQTASEGAYRV